MATPKKKSLVEKKKIFEEFDEFEALSDASIDGAVITVSPLKQGRKSQYFEGQLSDGTHQVRFVGFSRKQHEDLQKAMTDQQTVRLLDCEIKKSRYAEKYEVIVKKTSTISPSPKQIDLSSIRDLDNEIKLEDVASKDPYDQISVKVKVLKIDDPVTVNGGLTKQDVIISDNTGTVKFTIWEDVVNLLEVGQSYHLKNVVVREYMNQKYISMSKTSSEIGILNDDIGPVIEDQDIQTMFNASDETRFESTDIIGVQNIDTCKMCINCKVPVNQLSDSLLGFCPKCNAILVLRRCTSLVQGTLIVQRSVSSPTISLSIMGDLLLKIAKVEYPDQVTPDRILMNESGFIITCNSNNLVTGVTDVVKGQ